MGPSRLTNGRNGNTEKGMQRKNPWLLGDWEAEKAIRRCRQSYTLGGKELANMVFESTGLQKAMYSGAQGSKSTVTPQRRRGGIL